MQEDDKKILKDILDLVEENNAMLHSMKRSIAWSRFFRGVYWVVIIGSVVGSYYFLAPLIDQVKEAYNGAIGGARSIEQVGQTVTGNIQLPQGLIDQLKAAFNGQKQ